MNPSLEALVGIPASENSGRPHPVKCPPSGFTLIELLVVIVIIAILVSVTMLSMNVLGRDSQLREETDRLASLVGAVKEQAEMQGRDFGLKFYTDGYEFLTYDRRHLAWRPLEESLFRPRQFPDGVQPELFLEARQVVLKSRKESERPRMEDDKKEKGRKAEKEFQDDETPRPETPEQRKKREAFKPHVFILSSGDLSAFELKLLREGTDHEATILGKAEGTVEITHVDTVR